MNELLNVYGRRVVSAPVPKDVAKERRDEKEIEKQRLLAAVKKNTTLQQVLATVSTPPTELIGVLTKALGGAEAEIEFVERITYREY